MKIKCKECHSGVEECGYDINATDDGDVIEETQYFCYTCPDPQGIFKAKLLGLYISISKGILDCSEVYFEEEEKDLDSTGSSVV